MHDAVEKGMATIGKIGCDRVLTTWEGGSVPYANAAEFGITVEIIFIRDDGWTLGCHRTMVGNAYELWKEEWVAVLIKPMTDPMTIAFFERIGTKGLSDILPQLNSLPNLTHQPKHLSSRTSWRNRFNA